MPVEVLQQHYPRIRDRSDAVCVFACGCVPQQLCSVCHRAGLHAFSCGRVRSCVSHGDLAVCRRGAVVVLQWLAATAAVSVARASTRWLNASPFCFIATTTPSSLACTLRHTVANILLRAHHPPPRPWPMLVEAQSQAHANGFHFHKEIFDL